jgi:hypothetical protein
MRKIIILMISLFIVSCNNPEGKMIMNWDEMGTGGIILLILGILVIPVSVILMSRKKKRR